MIRIKEPEEYCFVWSIEVFQPENISFNSAKENQQEPSECETHVHIPQSEICFQDFPVYQAFKEYLLQAKGECGPEKTPLQPELIRTRQIAKPDYTSYHHIKKYEV